MDKPEGLARPMANSPVIELATLPERHPKTGGAILKQCGSAFVLRLSVDPTRLLRGATTQEVTIDRNTPTTKGQRVEEIRELGWSGDTGVSEDDCTRLAISFNEQRITEDAALAVMFLLINELESWVVQAVLPIGSGGDYLASRKGQRGTVQVEVSGLREDESGRRSSSRLAEKCSQVLSKCPAGFASVTTFRRLKAGILHSYLHYVERRPVQSKGGKGKGRRR